jgi:hypothetical protein
MSLTKVTYSMIDGAYANVDDFGADPTGIANSAAAIQAAIDQAATSSGVVQFSNGTYLINSTLNLVGKKVRLLGAGIGTGLSSMTPTTIIKAGVAMTSMINAVETTDPPYSPLIIQDMTFDGNNLATSCIDMKGRHYSLLDRLWLVRALKGINFELCYSNTFDSVGCSEVGVGFYGNGSNHASVFRRCNVNTFNDYGFVFLSGADGNQAVHLDTCSVQFGSANANGCVVIAGLTNLTITAGYIGENVDAPLFVVNGGLLNLQGCYLYYGYTNRAYCFALTSGSQTFVQNSFIIPDPALNFAGLIKAPITAGDSGKVEFDNCLINAPAPGNITWEGNPLGFGAEQPVFTSRYGRNWTSFSTNCSIVSPETGAAVPNQRKVQVTNVTGSPATIGLRYTLADISERFQNFSTINKNYLVVVYEANKPVDAYMSSGAGLVAPTLAIGTLPVTTDATGNIRTYIQVDKNLFDNAYTTLEFYIQSPTDGDYFTLREVYFSDNRVVGWASGRTTTNLYKC